MALRDRTVLWFGHVIKRMILTSKHRERQDQSLTSRANMEGQTVA
jgi:hypothetical protein